MFKFKTMELDFYYKEKKFIKNYFYFNNNLLFLNRIIRKLGLEPGIYRYKSDHKKLIPLRTEIDKILEIELLKFPVDKLSRKILSIISDKIYYKSYLNFIRSNKVKKSLLFYDVNEIRNQIKVLKYIIEKRLELHGKNRKVTKKSQNLEFVIMLSNFLFYFNTCMDFIYYQLDLGYIEIDDDYNLTVKFKTYNYNSDYLENSYDASDKIINDDILREYSKCFKLDMGFDINDFTEISSCLCVDIPIKKSYKVKNNVVEMKRDKLINLISKYNKSNLSIDIIIRIIDYLTIDKDNVNAIYKREDQFNRIDQKPIICDGDILYYSPALVSTVYRFFIEAIIISDFPFKKDLPNICKLLEKIKKQSEKQIVYDILSIIKTNVSGPFYVEKKLHQMNSTIDFKYSESIGDYDILAVDIDTRTIYNIEIKNLKLFSTIYEMYRQYHGFYDKNNYEYKFSRRIDALKKYYNVVFPSCFIKDISSYKLINIFLTNKNFIPLFSSRNDIMYLCYPMLKDYFMFQKNKADFLGGIYESGRWLYSNK